MRHMAQVPRTRVMLPFNGQLDGSGNGVITSQRFPSLSLVNVALQVSAGTANWSVFVTPSNESGNLVGFVGAGVGGSVGGGPYPVAANEYVSVEIQGGTPNAQVFGSIYGVQGIAIDDLPVIPSSSMLTGVAVSGSVGISGNVPVINAGNTQLQTFASEKGLANFVAASPGIITQTITPDNGIKSLAVIGPAVVSRVRIVGHVTGNVYYDTGVSSTPLPNIVPFIYLVNTLDSSLDVSMTFSVAGTAQLVETWSVLPPLTQLATPAIWQAPNQFNAYAELTTVGTTTLIPAAANQNIRLFGYSIELEATGTAIAGFVQDTLRSSPANRIIPFGQAINTIGMTNGNRGGGLLPNGAGLVLNYALGSGTVRCSVDYSVD